MSEVAKTEVAKTSVDYVKSYGAYVVVFIIFLVACYFAYTTFKDNKNGDDDKEDDCGDRSVMDYNLQEEINELKNIQRKVLETLSDDTEM